MKRISLILGLVISAQLTFAQATEIEQLLLDVEKLSQFKQMLSDLKEGYDILVTGYGAVKNISEGNFNLHRAFLDGLLQVSPAVQRYERVKDIVNYQLRIIKEGKKALDRVGSDNNFTADEIVYISKVISNLFEESTADVGDLIVVVTAGKLRMSDDERLKAIDGIFSEVVDKYGFLKNFISSAGVLSNERIRDKQEIEISKSLHGIY